MADRALSIYLSDHFAGATAGVELVRRVRGSNRDSAEFGEPLAHLCEEIEADRETLRRVMERLDVEPGRLKPAAAWVVEKLGRLKLNGQLRGYSPLSRLVELEGLAIGIAGKTCLWRTLEKSLGPEWDGFDFSQLAKRAERQRDSVEQLRRRAVAEALPTDESQGPSSQPAHL
ncbi:MAG TPA: hypothetical protein VN752_02030 [Solirubrobacterales bacterium]|nr:hypothetical protein [Solirubrobacterales bacterium]